MGCDMHECGKSGKLRLDHQKSICLEQGFHVTTLVFLNRQSCCTKNDTFIRQKEFRFLLGHIRARKAKRRFMFFTGVTYISCAKMKAFLLPKIQVGI